MNTVRDITKLQPVQKALIAFEEEQPDIINLAIAIQQIPAPTFSEAERAAFIEQQFRDLELQDVERDNINNVFGKYPGVKSGPGVIISAHSDTVFSADTDLTVRYENGMSPKNGLIFGPGLADNALGVAGLISLAKVLAKYHIKPKADVWFVANVCEEGLGDLRGMRAVVDRFGKRPNYIVVEGGSFGFIYHKAIGVRRYRLSINTPGGHSWGDFGQPSAIHTIARFIAACNALTLPVQPKTTFNIGVIEGGTTINAIAARATCQIDIRSEEQNTLDDTIEQVVELARTIGNIPGVQATLEEIGNRPGGTLALDLPLITWAADALRCVGWNRISFIGGSTDANIPISKGIPAVCIGLANSANTHRLDEYLDPTNLAKGLGQLLLLVLKAAGCETP